MSITLKPVIGGLLAAATIAMATPVLAEPPADAPMITIVSPAGTQPNGTTTRTIKVTYSDLDLTDAIDQDRFARRVERAADSVCADQPDTLWSKLGYADYARCHAEAVASAMTRLPAAQPAGN